MADKRRRHRNDRFGGKVITRRNKLQMTQRDLAKMLDLTTNTVQSIEKGEVPNGPNLINLANSLDCSLDWLCGLSNADSHSEDGDKYEDRRISPTVLNDLDGKMVSCSFSFDWLRKVASSPENVICTIIRGPAMAPFLQEGDIVLVDRGNTLVRGQAKVYAVSIDGVIAINRLEVRPGGIIRIFSENQEIAPPFEMKADELTIIGQVFWLMRAL